MRSILRPLTAVGALLALALSAFASPAPVLRSRPGGVPALPRAAAPFSAHPADALERACGTNLDAVADMLADDARLASATALPTPHSRDVNGIAVLEDDGSFFYTNSGNQPLLDLAAASRAFYRTHGDDYDFVCFYLASGLKQWLGSPGALAAAWPLRNDTQGIGLDAFDYGAAFGSPSRLQLVLTMNGLQRYPADPDAPIGGPGDTFSTMDVLAHEFAHRWLAYVYVDSAGTITPALLGRDYQHWNFFFDADSSYMEGCDWTAVRPDSFVTTGVSATYGALDQYLMGLRTKAEMDSFFVVNDPTAFNPPGTYIPISVPQVGIGCDGRATWWHVDDIERAHGPRVPDGSVAPRHWRMAVCLVVPRGTDATSADLAKLGVIRDRFPTTMIESTGGRATVDLSLDSRAGRVAIAHAPLADTEDGASARPVGARVTIEQSSLPLAVVPTTVLLHWRADTTGAFTDVPLVNVAPDSFAAAIPAVSQGRVQYWLSASSDSAGIDARLPAAGAAAPFGYTVGPDTTPPRIVHAVMRAQSRDRFPQALLARVTDNVGVDSVRVEYSVDGGAVQALPAGRAGADTFVATLPGARSIGQRIAYRFVARDGSLAHNMAVSNPAFDTLRVTHDWAEDFENPSAWYHQNVLYSWRDDWQLDSAVSSPSGGTSWHAGGAGGDAYPPHVDASLYSPLVYDVVPGTTFTFDERHELESSSAFGAFDACRLEVSVANGPWQPAAPVPGYTHQMDEPGMPFAAGSACWSGTTPGWVTRTLDLSPYAPGPVRLRVRTCSDDLIGRGGVWVDRVRVHYPDETTVAVAPTAEPMALAPPWPNPSRGTIRLPLALPRLARIEWTLLDVQGRHAATLFAGTLPAGRAELAGAAPEALPAGLYFARLRVDGRARSTSRVAIVR